MLTVHLAGLGLLAPGLESWAEAQAVFGGQRPYRPRGLPRLAPDLLPPNERRRASATTRIALRVAQEALAGGHGGNAQDLLSVFACSGGDYQIIHQLCTALAQGERAVSPTLFHNSVHNAPAGYFAIGSQSSAGSTSLTAYDGSFAAGLLEAATLAGSENRPVLLVVYDEVPPPPLWQCRPLSAPFGAALRLVPEAEPGVLATLSLSLVRGQAETRLEHGDLEALRRGNPAARALGLLARLATPATVVLPWLADLQLQVEHRPW